MRKTVVTFCTLIFTLTFLNAQQLMRSLDQAHNGAEITTITINNDGSKIITGGVDKRAYIWEVRSGDKLKVLSHGAEVNDVSFNSNGKLFVSGSEDGRVILFDAEEGKPKKLLKDHAAGVTAVIFNPINDDMASGSKDNTVKLWSMKTGKAERTLRGHAKQVNTLAFSPDGKLLASGSDDNTIKIWDVERGTAQHTIEADSKGVLSLAFSPDGKYLVSGGANGKVFLWDPVDGNKVGEYPGLKGKVYSLAFSPDVQYIAASGSQKNVVIWQVDDKTEVSNFEAHGDEVYDIAFSDKDNVFVSVSKDGAIKLWDVNNLKIGKRKFAKSNDKPKLECSSLSLEDNNSNGIIENGDNPRLTFTIRNNGKGKAYNLVAKISISQYIEGLSFEEEQLIGNLDANQGQKINIPLFTSAELKTSSAKFIVQVEEANGNNPPAIELNFQTKGAEDYNYVMIVGHEFTSATGKAEIGAPINLKLTIKNTSKGNAENVRINFILPDKVLAVNKLSEAIPSLGPGASKEVNVEFYADEGFSGEELKIELKIDGAAFSNADDMDLSVKMNEDLPGKETYAETVSPPPPRKEEPQEQLYRGGANPLQGLNVAKSKTMEIGNYYALIVGIDSYKGHWTPLQNAVNDAKAIETLLKTTYKFDHFKSLYNENATRENIIKELEWLVSSVTEKDNVFIYYSGHGEFKKELNKGYWVPVDANSSSTSQYISNSDLQTFLGGIKSKHTLLVSDACFSGDIFRGNTMSVPFEESEKYYREVHNLVSRQAITSGGIEPVMDGGQDGHSVFAYYLLKALKENNSRYFDAGQLYTKLKIPVVNNSEQTPRISPIKKTGDEGGQFIFIKK